MLEERNGLVNEYYSSTMDYPTKSVYNKTLFWSYPQERFTFVFTQPVTQLKQPTIEDYKRVIKDGHNPIVLTASTRPDGLLYVIDGHHKLAAYNSVNKDPVFIHLTRTIASEIDRTLLENRINSFPYGSEEWRALHRWLRRYDEAQRWR